MARGCSDSDSEQERHDRFKSERNPSSIPVRRNNIPSSLDSFSSRARSPLRPDFRNSRHRSRYSEDRRKSPSHREKKYKETDTSRSRSNEFRDRHRSKRSHDRKHDDRYENDSRKRVRTKDEKTQDHDRKSSREKDHKHKRHREKKGSSKEKDRKLSCVKRRKSEDEVVDSHKSEKIPCQSSSDKSRYSDSPVYIRSDSDEKTVINEEDCKMLPRYYELVDESVDSDPKVHSDDKHSKKHKKSRDRSQSRHGEVKRKKKEKKHRKRHEKRKSESESDSKLKSDKCSLVNDNEQNQRNSNDSDSDLNIDSQNNETDVRTNLENDADGDSSIGKIVDLGNTKDENIEAKIIHSEQEDGELSGSESEQYFGPALPPGKREEQKVFGPKMPTDEELYGPALPPSATAAQEENAVEEEVEDGDIIGPHPAGHESMTQSALDARASFLQIHVDNKTDDNGIAKREAWMIELPEAKRAQIGLGPRKFRANAAPDMSDRSAWTDTPQDKAKKLLDNSNDDAELDTRKLEIMEKNKEMERLAKKSEKKAKSLLEMHQKDIKKKKKKDKDKKPERRPFSREIDLQTNRFDEAQKKSIIKKAQLLNTRFSSGESKYL